MNASLADHEWILQKAPEGRLECKDWYTSLLQTAREQDEANSSGTYHQDAAMAELGRGDLFFLLVFVLDKEFCDNDWVFARCRDVQRAPDGHIDLWSREHFKSTIITFGMSIMEIIRDPNVTIGIFSHTKPVAKKFLNQIKREFEENADLKHLYPDIFYQDPNKQSPKWSEDGGIMVKRTQNKKELTVEGWGLVDGQPTGAHFDILVYDDVVTIDSVVTAEQINKTTDAYRVSLNLGARGGRRRVIGTRYHARDTYATMLEAGTYQERIWPATVDGVDPLEAPDFVPVHMTREELLEKRHDMGVYVFGCQMLQNPHVDSAMGFRAEWIETGALNKNNLNIYILVDPASGKKKDTGDYTAMAVIGVGADQNYYLLDAIRDRLNLTQTIDKLLDLYTEYWPEGVGYEEYGLQRDIDAIKTEMANRNFRFPIQKVGGKQKKEDRIRRLVPLFESGRFFIQKDIRRRLTDNTMANITRQLIEDEILLFPNAKHDDLLDAMSRIFDIRVNFPAARNDEYQEKMISMAAHRNRRLSSTGWLAR